VGNQIRKGICRTVFFSFIILICSVKALSSQANLWSIEAGDSRPLLVLNQELQLIPKKISLTTAHYQLEIRYPQIIGSSKIPAANDFNRLVNHFINTKVIKFKHDLSQAGPNNHTNSLKINYELAGFVSESQNTEYISIRFTIESFKNGMAHPDRQTEVTNYNLKANRSLALSDLFSSNSGYLETISKNCIKQLQAKHLPNEMIKSGAESKQDNYNNWNLTLSGLLITFEEGQVAPRYYGIQQILIPYSSLNAIFTHKTACTLGVINCDIT
jgi:hypothetical protein